MGRTATATSGIQSLLGNAANFADPAALAATVAKLNTELDELDEH